MRTVCSSQEGAQTGANGHAKSIHTRRHFEPTRYDRPKRPYQLILNFTETNMNIPIKILRTCFHCFLLFGMHNWKTKVIVQQVDGWLCCDCRGRCYQQWEDSVNIWKIRSRMVVWKTHDWRTQTISSPSRNAEAAQEHRIHGPRGARALFHDPCGLKGSDIVNEWF